MFRVKEVENSPAESTLHPPIPAVEEVSVLEHYSERWEERLQYSWGRHLQESMPGSLFCLLLSAVLNAKKLGVEKRVKRLRLWSISEVTLHARGLQLSSVPRMCSPGQVIHLD